MLVAWFWIDTVFPICRYCSCASKISGAARNRRRCPQSAVSSKICSVIRYLLRRLNSAALSDVISSVVRNFATMFVFRLFAFVVGLYWLYDPPIVGVWSTSLSSAAIVTISKKHGLPNIMRRTNEVLPPWQLLDDECFRPWWSCIVSGGKSGVEKKWFKSIKFRPYFCPLDYRSWTGVFFFTDTISAFLSMLLEFAVFRRLKRFLSD